MTPMYSNVFTKLICSPEMNSLSDLESLPPPLHLGCNRMLSATSNIGLEVFNNFLNMFQFQYRLILVYQSMPLERLR